MKKINIKTKILVGIITIFPLVFQVLISGLIYKLFQHLNTYLVMLIDLIISLSPVFFLAYMIKKYHIKRKKEKSLDKESLEEALKKGSKIVFFLFAFFLYFFIELVWYKETNKFLFKIGNWLTGLFAENFEEKLLIWNLSYEIDISAFLLGVSIIGFLVMNEDKSKREKQIIATVFIFIVSIIIFLAIPVSTAKDLKEYHLTKDTSIFYKPCKFEKFIITSGVKGGDSFYIKCAFEEQIRIKSPIFLTVICNLPKGYSCNEESLKGKNVILIKSLYSNYVYGIKLEDN